MTLSIIIRRNRSYKCPEANEKIFMGSSSTPSSFPPLLLPVNVLINRKTNGQDEFLLTNILKSNPYLAIDDHKPLLASFASANNSSCIMSGFLFTFSFMTCDWKEPMSTLISVLFSGVSVPS